jgi:hypothetical protein
LVAARQGKVWSAVGNVLGAVAVSGFAAGAYLLIVGSSNASGGGTGAPTRAQLAWSPLLTLRVLGGVSGAELAVEGRY